MQLRVDRHRIERPAAWTTVERPADVGSAIRDAATDVVLLDCLTMLAANALDRRRPADGEAALAAVAGAVTDLLAGADGREGTLFVVTNEVGLAVHPPTALGRWFQDALGLANQRLAARASEVTLVVAGIPVTVKGGRALAHDGGS
jgi:adenosylcobinamide kinase/adenosylcobinamide-phosphate guanylyltransferase